MQSMIQTINFVYSDDNIHSELLILLFLSYVIVYCTSFTSLFSFLFLKMCSDVNTKRSIVVHFCLKWYSYQLYIHFSRNIPSFFSLSPPFSKSIFSIRMTYSFRALNSTSNAIFILFSQLILILKTKLVKDEEFSLNTQHSISFSPHFLNRFSPLKLNILLEHWTLHGMMYSTSFSNGF